ncbi:uncharacterized protein LOC119099487 [Pollicipes pollicipes]|nr:uncharacterized protein LOC119099487 [Pollicipes pollicipes]
MELFSEAEQGHRSQEIVTELLQYTNTLTSFSEVSVAVTEESRRLQQLMRAEPSLISDATVQQLASTVADLTALSSQLQSFFTETEAMRDGLLAVTQAEEPAAPEEPAAAEEAESSVRDSPTDDTAEESGDEEDEDDAPGEAREGRVKFTTVDSLRLDKMVQVSEIDREQRARVEKAVRQKLGRVGLDGHGPEIKVRFLKYPDVNNLQKEHTLTDEEVSAFENALVTIIMGGQEALLEHDKNRQLARNYEYSFEEAVRDLDESPLDEEDEPASAANDDESLFTLV